MHNEVIVCLEAALLPGKLIAGERRNRVCQIRSELPSWALSAADIDLLNRHSARDRGKHQCRTTPQPRPTNGIFVAMMVINCTLVVSGSDAI